ncbi:MAG: NosD domain-containing protein, partial [Candidatus Micrarchaeia archaeon]
SSNNSFSNITSSNNSNSGVYIEYSSNNSFSNITSSNNSQYGIYLYSSSNNSFSNITSSNNSNSGVYIEYSSNNLFYNNLFNNTKNIIFRGTIYENFWNISLDCLSGPNIVGGQCIGGNFWANPSGTGFSQKCRDSDENEICDSSYTINSSNIDYLPLSLPSIQITSCDILNQTGRKYVLTQNLSSSGTCFTITANNLTLDCQGHTINHMGSGSGVYASGRTNITIKNCNIIGSTSVPNNYGIYFASTSNSFILNNNLSSNYRGIFLSSSSNYNTLSNITASSNWEGIYLSSSSNNTLSNITVFNNNYSGIFLSSSSNNIVSNNIANSNGQYGIYLEFGSDNNLSHNNMSNNQYNLYINEYEETQNIDTSNLVDGKPVYWLKNVENQVFDSSTNAGLFACFNCNNITVKDLTFEKNSYGLLLEETTNSFISNITTSNNALEGIHLGSSSSNSLFNITSSNNERYGIYFEYSFNNSLSNILVSNNEWDGIHIEISSNNSLFNITSSNNQECGIYLFKSSYNNISKILAYDNYCGLYIDSDPGFESDYNYVFESTFSTSEYGIRLYNSNNNFIFNNEVNSIYTVGIDLWYSNDNNISNNNIFENNYYSINFHDSYYNIISNNNISTSNGAIGIKFESDSSNNTIVNNFINGSFVWEGAIHFSSSNENNVSNNTILISSGNGITLEQESRNIRIFNNSISTNANGIYIKDSSDNTEVFNNSIVAGCSIFIFNSNSNFIFNNDLVSTDDFGLGLDTSFNNIISSNKIKTLSSDPADYFGVYLFESHDNIIYDNIINGTVPVHFEISIYQNFWNTTLNCSSGPNIVGGQCIGGNFYATPSGNGFSETCNDTDNDGFCDEAYDILDDGSNVDYYPLAIFATPSDTTPPSVQILSPSNNTWHKSEINVTLLATDDTSSQIVCKVYLNNNNVENLTLSNNSPLTIFRSLPNSKNDIYLNCSDQAGNSNVSNLITIYFDNINPTILSFTLSSTIVYVGDTITYNCTASDNSESYEGSVTTVVTGIDTSSAGTKTARCTATDTAGNSIYEERTYTVNQIILPPSGGGGGGCSPVWQCSEWTECSKEGIRTRTCIDINNCGTTTGKPSETAACVYACMPDWKCSPWSECSPSGIQTRTCIDNNNCGLLSPSTSRSCLYIPKELTANSDQTDLNAISAIQSNFINLFQSLEDKDYNKIESYFSSAIEQTNFLLRTSPTTNNLNISQTVINNGLQLSDYLIQQEHFSSSSIILSNISSIIPFLSQIDASYANKLTNSLLQKSSQFFSA